MADPQDDAAQRTLDSILVNLEALVGKAGVPANAPSQTFLRQGIENKTLDSLEGLFNNLLDSIKDKLEKQAPVAGQPPMSQSGMAWDAYFALFDKLEEKLGAVGGKLTMPQPTGNVQDAPSSDDIKNLLREVMTSLEQRIQTTTPAPPSPQPGQTPQGQPDTTIPSLLQEINLRVMSIDNKMQASGVGGEVNVPPGEEPAPEGSGKGRKTLDFLGKAIRSERTGDVLGNVSGAIGSAGSMIPVIGPVVQAVGTFGKALMDTLEKLRRWGDQLHESNMQFAAFSGAMMRVQAENEIAQFYLNRASGDARASSARQLVQGRVELEQTLRPFEDNFARIKNSLMSIGLSTVAKLMDNPFFRFATKVLEKIAESLEDGPVDDELTVAKAMKDLNLGKWWEEQGRPTRWQARVGRRPGEVPNLQD